jgi:hypothetical protein
MKPHSGLQFARNAWFFRLLLLMLILAPGSLFAQQGWPQNPQYAYGQYPQQPYAQQPYAAQPSYPALQQYPSQQPYPVQQPYPTQQPYPEQQPYDQGYQQPPAQSLTAEQLEQLVAPIALYPDSLVAQLLVAATYPAQVVGADHWLQAQGNVDANQIAYSVDAEPWDPSVKALTAFPQVLALLDQNLQWTTDLGNAYYNQPQDVLQTIQVLRQRAQDAGTLQNTPQETVSDNQGYIQLASPDPQMAYVPAYNPWDVYGQPVQPYSGFSLLGSLASFAGSAAVRYGPGIAMAAFNHTPFGLAAWALNWLTQSVLFHQTNYQSNSTSVAHWAVPRNGMPQHTVMPARQYGSNRSQSYSQPPYQSGYARPATAYARQFQPNYARPPAQNYAYSRPQPQPVMPVRPQSYARPANSYYGNSGQSYGARPSPAYASPQQSWRSPSPVATSRPGDYAQRGYSPSRFYLGERAYASPAPIPMSRGYAQSPSRAQQSGGFHLFGGGHNSERSYGGGSSSRSFHAEKPPKEHSQRGGHSGGHRR